MASAIQIAGVVMCVVLAAIAVRPDWRLPALIVALLSIPGNVDNLLPQFSLDPHPLPTGTAPVVSVVDLLLGVAVALTAREGRRPTFWVRRLTILATVLTGAVAAIALVALSRGVEPAAVARGVVLFARIPALFFLVGALEDRLGDGSRVAAAFVLGGVALVGNGVYTTMVTGEDRFTAATFGRNGFAIALILVTIVAAGVAFRGWNALRSMPTGPLALVAASVAAACLFGASATGTRMAFLILLGASAAGIVLYPVRIGAAQALRIVAVGVVTTLVLAASVAWTVAGARTVSVVTDPGTTIDVVTHPGDLPSYSEVRRRGQFWDLAIAMARAEPLTGVGPFQWNVQRYVLDPDGPVVVVDAHNSYLQIAAEFGLVIVAMYGVLLAVEMLIVGLSVLRRGHRARIGWAGIGICVAALAYPFAELTNSHFFNVRLGAVGWLLIATAVTLVTSRASAGRPTPDGALEPSPSRRRSPGPAGWRRYRARGR